MIPCNFEAVDIQTIHADWLLSAEVQLAVLRLDRLHHIVSGNKWFKLQHYLSNAICDRAAVATFGGAWSNHLIATAYACRQMNVPCIGVVRGEKPSVLSATLQHCMDYGMALHFISREDYRNKAHIKAQFRHKNIYWVNEGGHGPEGAKGAKDICQQYDLTGFDYIVAGVGTGTMLAGLIAGVQPTQQVLGISAMKNNLSLENEVNELLTQMGCESRAFAIAHDYHFGGFGKHPQALIDYMNDVYRTHQLPLDLVYTAKVFYAIQDLAAKNHFRKGSRVLMIHSGGLQGNRSLPEKLLAF